MLCRVALGTQIVELLGLTPSGLFMGLSSTIIYTSELILWFHHLKTRPEVTELIETLKFKARFPPLSRVWSTRPEKMVDSGRQIFYWSKLTMPSPWVQPWVRGRSTGVSWKSAQDRGLRIEDRGSRIEDQVTHTHTKKKTIKSQKLKPCDRPARLPLYANVHSGVFL